MASRGFSTPTNNNPGKDDVLPTPLFGTMHRPFSSKSERVYKTTSELLSEQPPKAPAKTEPCRRIRSKLHKRPAAVMSFLPLDQQPKLHPKYDQRRKYSYKDQIYKTLQVVGTGSFGEVIRVVNKYTDKISVLKCQALAKSGILRTRQECEVRQHEALSDHPNCVKLLSAWHEDSLLWIEQQALLCSLADLIKNKCKLEQEGKDTKFKPMETWSVLIDMLKALQHIHGHGYVHMDVKPDNILVNGRAEFVLGDFGIMFKLDSAEGRQDGDNKYVAPEVLHDVHGYSADIYSLGVTIFELATHIFMDQESAALLRNGVTPDILNEVPEDLQKIIRLMINIDPKKRPTVEQLLDMPEVCHWVTVFKTIDRLQSFPNDVDEFLKARAQDFNKTKEEEEDMDVDMEVAAALKRHNALLAEELPDLRESPKLRPCMSEPVKTRGLKRHLFRDSAAQVATPATRLFSGASPVSSRRAPKASLASRSEGSPKLGSLNTNSPQLIAQHTTASSSEGVDSPSNSAAVAAINFDSDEEAMTMDADSLSSAPAPRGMGRNLLDEFDDSSEEDSK